jgi:uncharacterized repeat protein (TIGR01451 family)
MKKQILTTTSLMGCVLAGLIFAGCAQQQQQHKAYKPAPAPAPKAEPAPAPKTSCSDPTWGLIRMSKAMPAEAALGSEFSSELTISAASCAGNVVIHDMVPAGASYVRSEPAATVDGSDLTWKLGNMDAGQVKKIQVVFRADKEGNIVNCAIVTADPRVCASTFVGKATLVIEKSGPETAVLGSDVTYNVVVKNTGTAVAKDVVVTDPVPEGMSHSSGKSELSIPVGDLGPGQSKPLSVVLKANKRGKVCNVATATSSNAGKVSDDACTVILQPGLKVEKTGTKDQILGRNADYQIVVSNTGDTALQNVSVTDTAPAATTIVAAPDATVSGNTATWNVAEIKPGDKKSMTVKLTSKTEGTHCNSVTATAGALSDKAQACTVWTGIGAVLLEMVDSPDPIQVGETSTYTIKITNQGFADINNVNISFVSDEETTPISSPEGTVSGKKASFPAIAKLAPKQVVTYTIVVRGVSVGNSINKVVLTCNEIKSPVEETESTTVY